MKRCLGHKFDNLSHAFLNQIPLYCMYQACIPYIWLLQWHLNIYPFHTNCMYPQLTRQQLLVCLRKCVQHIGDMKIVLPNAHTFLQGMEHNRRLDLLNSILVRMACKNWLYVCDVRHLPPAPSAGCQDIQGWCPGDTPRIRTVYQSMNTFLQHMVDMFSILLWK